MYHSAGTSEWFNANETLLVLSAGSVQHACIAATSGTYAICVEQQPFIVALITQMERTSCGCCGIAVLAAPFLKRVKQETLPACERTQVSAFIRNVERGISCACRFHGQLDMSIDCCLYPFTRYENAFRRSRIVDIQLLRDNDGVIDLELFILVPRFVFARIVSPMQREDFDNAGMPQLSERIAETICRGNIMSAIRRL